MRLTKYLNEKNETISLGKAMSNIDVMKDDKSLEPHIIKIMKQLQKLLDKEGSDKVNEKLIKRLLKDSSMKKLVHKFEQEVDDFKSSINDIVSAVIKGE